jgi:hypothetical protein
MNFSITRNLSSASGETNLWYGGGGLGGGMGLGLSGLKVEEPAQSFPFLLFGLVVFCDFEAICGCYVRLGMSMRWVRDGDGDLLFELG